MANSPSAEGTFRIVFTDRRQTHRNQVLIARSEVLDANKTDKLQQYWVDQKPFYADEDDLILLEYRADADTVIDQNSIIRIPIRVLNKSTGEVSDDFMSLVDFGIAGNINCSAGIWTVIGQYVVKAQEVISIGHTSKDNSQMYCEFLTDGV